MIGKCKTNMQKVQFLKISTCNSGQALPPNLHKEKNPLADFNYQKHMASSTETRGPRGKNNYPYLFSMYLFNLLAGLGCWIWFYIPNYKVYDGKGCQLFAKAKEDLCSLSSLVHRTNSLFREVNVWQEEEHNPSWLHLPQLLFFLLTVPWADSWYFQAGPLYSPSHSFLSTPSGKLLSPLESAKILFLTVVHMFALYVV